MARATRVTWLLLLACSFAVAAPLLIHGPSCGHDFDFHLLSWLETAHDWHQGLINPQWLASANYGTGEPRFIFYPPASWILGALLGSAGTVLLGTLRGWTVAPALFTFLCVFSGGISVYLLARTMASRVASTVAACLFIANPYMLFVAYERTAYGELLATPLMALLLLGSLRRQLSVVALTVVIAALWLTNAPAAVMGCYTLAIVCALRLLKERNWLNAGKALASTMLGLASAGCYLVPAVWQQRWVQIGRAVSSGMRIEDSFLFAHTGQPYHDQVLYTASVIVVILFAIAASSIAVILCRRHGSRPQALWIFTSLLVAILCLQFSWSEAIWRAVPHLLYLQFPWRWMLVASIAAACILASAITRQRDDRAYAVFYYLFALTVAAASIWMCSHSFMQACDEQDRVSGQLEAFHSGAGVEGTDEYTATDADHSAIFQDLPNVRLLTNPDAEEPQQNAGDNPEWNAGQDMVETARGEAHIELWEPERKQIDVTTNQPAFAVLRLMDYPAWSVLLNGRAVIGRLKREDGLMVVAVPGGSSHILVQWKTTPDVILGREVSAAAALMLVSIFVLQRRLKTAEVRQTRT